MKIMISNILLSLLLFLSCAQNESTIPKEKVNQKEKDYWFNNEAEISSYKLSQARYGEIHEDTAVLVFVTEPFSKKNNAKADQPTKEDITVLKLNSTKNFNTGIYPYSMMTSTFFPFKNGEHSLKISSSSQEWCGHTYMELTNKKQFDINLSSYFEGQSFENLSIPKNILEDDIWTKIRLSPNDLPIGKMKMIPSFFYLRLMHKKMNAYDCVTSISTKEENRIVYNMEYPTLERSISIHFEKTFPHKIISWEESYVSGFGEKRKRLSTSATLIKIIKTDYWTKNANKDTDLRKTLGL